MKSRKQSCLLSQSDQTEADEQSFAARIEQCHILQKMFLSDKPISFLRMGDGELRFLLDWQRGKSPRFNVRHQSDQHRLAPEAFPRLISAYETCDFLDEYLRFPFNASNLKQLAYRPQADQLRCIHPSTTQIIFKWVELYLDQILEKRKCLFVGGEAGLLMHLRGSQSFQESAKLTLSRFDFGCLSLPESGRSYWTRTDAYKEWLADEIVGGRYEVIFVSAGPVAKILCSELSRELRVTMIDFGAALRGLTFSACSSASTALSSHMPFYYRVELGAFAKAASMAFPDLRPIELQKKLNRQLFLNFYGGIRGESLSHRYRSQGATLSEPENLDQYNRDVEAWRHHLKRLTLSDRVAATSDLSSLFRIFGISNWLPMNSVQRTYSRISARCVPFQL